MRHWCLVTALALAGVVPLAGCQRKTGDIAPPEAQVAPVSKPVTRMVTEYVDFTGRTNAVENVNIIPRVTGYLTKMPFKEGSDDVKEGDLLFEIDPQPYKAQLDASEARLSLSKASLKLAQVTNERFKELSKKEASAVSKQDLDKYQAQEDEAVANLHLSEANLISSKLNLDWTKVKSPIAGKVSRYYLTLGNLVTQDQTLLTTIVSVDPMYVFFDMDEPTYLRIKTAINQGKIKLTAKEEKIPVLMGLQGEDSICASGRDQLHRQPGLSDHGEYFLARRLPQSQGERRRTVARPWHVRADPLADRPASPGHAGHRPGGLVRPGAEKRVRRRC